MAYVVEQITSSGTIVNDYDQSYSARELMAVVLSVFPNSHQEGSRVFGTWCGIEYGIYCKNISYLGNPHPSFKKRIQIGDDFISFYKENKNKNITTLLIGVYHYNDLTLIVDFDTTKYIYNKAHNSSAHVMVNDLKNAVIFGTYSKEDVNENLITILKINCVEQFLQSKLVDPNYKLVPRIFTIFDDFFVKMKKEWNGIDCYREMIEANYHNKFLSEWAGTYLEFLFENYLLYNPDQSVNEHIVKWQDKKKNSGGIDLDLYFPKIKTYGDLKAHSNVKGENDGSVILNDHFTMDEVMENGPIYYIILNHNTVKDSDCDLEVTHYWNEKINEINKKNKKPDSYCVHMKNSISATDYIILDVNKYNKKHLGIYNQGKNSNGNKREYKYQTKKTNIDNFIVHRKKWDGNL